METGEWIEPPRTFLSNVEMKRIPVKGWKQRDFLAYGTIKVERRNEENPY